MTLVDALIALHDGWLKNPTSWDTSKDPCDDGWLGIWCNDDQTRVIGMYEIQHVFSMTNVILNFAYSNNTKKHFLLV